MLAKHILTPESGVVYKVIYFLDKLFESVEGIMNTTN